MKRKRTRLTFGMLLDWTENWGDSDAYHTQILAGVNDYARENGINLICFVTGRLSSPYDWERSRSVLLKFIDKNNIDGLLVLPAIGFYETKQNVVNLLKRYHDIPIVTVNESYGDFHCVSVDNYAGMRQIVEHVIKTHGCRRIAFIKGIAENGEARDRYDAYRDTLEFHGIPFDPELVYQGNYIFSSGSDAVKYLLEQGISFDAIVSANDNMAIGALTELYKRWGKIPENLPVTGFDNAESSWFHSLTTVHQPFYEQAGIAVDMLARLVRNELLPRMVKIPTDLILRSSCGCASFRMMEAFVEPSHFSSTQQSETEFKEGLLKELAILHETTGDENPEIRQGLVEREEMLIGALMAECESGITHKDFLDYWKNLILWAAAQKINLTIMHDLLSLLRKKIYSRYAGRMDALRVENLFQAARIQISETVLRTMSTMNNLAYMQNDTLDRLGEELSAHMEIKHQMTLLRKMLPEFGIPKGYVALYENHDSMEYARLILAFNGDKQIFTGNQGIRFLVRDFLPDEVVTDLEQERFSVVVQALHLGDDQLGYVVFGFETKIGKIFERIRYRLSMALKGTLLLESVLNQASHLEQQVNERTQDLSLTNRQLIKEISKREKAEKELKKTLKVLEGYNKELHHRSIRDELTRLYNRRGFMELGIKHFIGAQSLQKGFLMLFADLDNLKQINDTYGHSEGDQALIRTATILGQAFGPDDIVARLSGDEFTIIVPDAFPDDLAAIRKRLHQRFEKHAKASRKPYKLSISLGGAYYDPKSEHAFDDLLRLADESLYEEKQRKKSRDVKDGGK